MKDADFSPEFKRVLRFLLGGARFGLTGGLAVVSARTIIVAYPSPIRLARPDCLHYRLIRLPSIVRTSAIFPWPKYRRSDVR